MFFIVFCDDSGGLRIGALNPGIESSKLRAMKLFILFSFGFLTFPLFGQGSPLVSFDDPSRFSSTGATEEEARENIDCGPYEETGIVCKEVTDH